MKNSHEKQAKAVQNMYESKLERDYEIYCNQFEKENE